MTDAPLTIALALGAVIETVGGLGVGAGGVLGADELELIGIGWVEIIKSSIQIAASGWS